MSISFFYQKRFDGGVRTGLGIDDQMVLHHFVPGDADSDPALLWFVDIRCSGDRLPTDAEAARDWLLHHVPAIQHGLESAAERLEVGVDEESPLREPFKLPRPFRGEIIASSVRRLASGELAGELRALAASFELELGHLSPLVEA